jgi:hypothetical protein
VQKKPFVHFAGNLDIYLFIYFATMPNFSPQKNTESDVILKPENLHTSTKIK